LLPPGPTEAVGDHLEQCSSCQATIQELDAHKDTMLKLLRQPQPPALEEACQAAIDKVAAIATSQSSAPGLSEANVMKSMVGAAPDGPVSRDQFLAALEAAGLVDKDQWQTLQKLPAVEQAADGTAVARVLVERGALTKFQAALVCQNKAKN